MSKHLKTSYQLSLENLEKEKYVKNIVSVLLQRREQIYSKKVPTLECIAGDDGYLKYYYKCLLCGTILIDDHGEESCLEFDKYDCPTCKPEQKNFPFDYVPADEINKATVTAPMIIREEDGKLKFGCRQIPLKARLEIGLI